MKSLDQITKEISQEVSVRMSDAIDSHLDAFIQGYEAGTTIAKSARRCAGDGKAIQRYAFNLLMAAKLTLATRGTSNEEKFIDDLALAIHEFEQKMPLQDGEVVLEIDHD